MSTRHGVPHGYTPPVTHAPVACWRCRRAFADDPAGTGHEMIRVGGRNVAVHKPGNLECVPTLSHPDGVAGITPERS